MKTIIDKVAENRREHIIKQWDNVRKLIANGHTGSYPRDWFESVLGYYEDCFPRMHNNRDAPLNGAIEW